MKCFLSLLVINSIININAIAALSGFGGNQVGNGGDVVYCTDKSKENPSEKIKLLDLFESRIFSEKRMIEKQSIEAYLQTIANKLVKIDKKRAFIFKQAFDYKKSFQFSKDVEIQDVKDSHHQVLIQSDVDRKCELRQIALRSKIQKNLSRKYLVQKDLFEKLTPLNQAALISHEVIYEYVSFLGEKDSTKLRQYNALLFSKEFQEMDAKQYWSYVRKLKLPFIK